MIGPLVTSIVFRRERCCFATDQRKQYRIYQVFFFGRRAFSFLYSGCTQSLEFYQCSRTNGDLYRLYGEIVIFTESFLAKKIRILREDDDVWNTTFGVDAMTSGIRRLGLK